ncbi:unnamed protein product [Colias eurytheme]|nr:unnamed protein product [Colias eurytheme]
MLRNGWRVAWVLGWLMCKTVPYVQGLSVAASVYSLVAVSLDSHFRPMYSEQLFISGKFQPNEIPLLLKYWTLNKHPRIHYLPT